MPINKKKLWISSGVLVVIIIIIIIAVAQSKKTTQTPTDNNTVKTEQNTTNIPEAPKNAGTVTVASVAIPSVGTVVSNTSLKDAQVVVPGANLVTKDNKVVTPEGKVVDNTAIPNSPTAPHMSAPLASISDLPATVVKIEVSAAGIKPNNFSVKAGAPVSIAFSSTDDFAHTIMFDDSSLTAIGVGLGPHVSRAITFNAPTKAGNYTFRCGFPGHFERGETGTMIVK